MKANLIKNAAGRPIPEKINDEPVIPFLGVGKYKPAGRKFGPKITSCTDFPADGDKTVSSLKDALLKAGIKDLNLRGNHLLISFNSKGVLITDEKGMPEVRLCNFEFLKRI